LAGSADTDLARLVKAWPTLSKATRRDILRLVDAALLSSDAAGADDAGVAR